MTEPARPLRAAIRARPGLLITSSMLFAGWQAAEALVPVFVGQVIDSAIAPSDVSALVGWLLALAVLFTLLSAGFRFGERLRARVAEHAGMDLRLALTTRVLDPRGGAGAGRAPGELLSIATLDATRTAEITGVVSGAGIIAAGVSVAAVFLLLASPVMGLIVLLGLPPVLVALNLATRALERRSGDEQERAAAATALATDLLAGLRVVQGLGAEERALTRYRAASQAALAARRRATRLLAIQAGTTLAVTSAFLAVVALVGGRLAARGEITIGELVAAVGLAQYLIGPLTWIGFLLASLAQARASASRVAAVLDAPRAVPEATPASSPDPGTSTSIAAVPGPAGALGLTVRGLRHGPLHDLDLDAAAGAITALVTADPAVAAAVLDCLAREVAPAAGTVRLGGVDVLAQPPEVTRALLLVAAHDADLFEETVPANVALTAADPGRLAAALSAAAADEVIATVGPDRPLSEWGRSLSGGQRQRVALARALAADPPILVLHDPTTAVDAVTETRIAAGLRTMRAGRTTVLVTTSPPLLAAADAVVFLAAGSASEAGTHAELAAASARYRDAVLG